MPHHPPGRRPKRLDRAQIRADVLRGLAEGLPLTVVARRHDISQQAIAAWQARDPGLADEIAGARALGWDSLAVECLDIIDDDSRDVVLDAEGVPHFNMAKVTRDKARCEMRLKLLACWDVGRYGPAKTVRVEGDITTTHTHVIDPRAMDEAGRAALREVLVHAKAQGLLPAPVDADFEEVEEGLGPEEDVADG